MKTNHYKTKFHKDGTITIWNIYRQQWERHRADQIPDDVLASVGTIERERIYKHAGKGAK
jgi:hypothetical protein